MMKNTIEQAKRILECSNAPAAEVLKGFYVTIARIEEELELHSPSEKALKDILVLIENLKEDCKALEEYIERN